MDKSNPPLILTLRQVAVKFPLYIILKCHTSQRCIYTVTPLSLSPPPSLSPSSQQSGKEVSGNIHVISPGSEYIPVSENCGRCLSVWMVSYGLSSLGCWVSLGSVASSSNSCIITGRRERERDLRQSLQQFLCIKPALLGHKILTGRERTPVSISLTNQPLQLWPI